MSFFTVFLLLAQNKKRRVLKFSFITAYQEIVVWFFLPSFMWPKYTLDDVSMKKLVSCQSTLSKIWSVNIHMLSLSSQSCIRLNYYSLCNFDRCIMPSWRYWKEFINVHKLQTMVRWFRICKFCQIDTRIRCNTRNILGKTYLVRLFSASFFFFFSKFRGPQQCMW